MIQRVPQPEEEDGVQPRDRRGEEPRRLHRHDCTLPAAGQRPMRLDILKYDEATRSYVTDQKPKLQPACQMQCTDGMEVKSDTSPHVADARKAVQELLLLNHPVDCPICDQAGECRL